MWAALALTAAAFGQSAPTKVGVINIQSALISTKDGQKAAQELETRRSPKAKEFEKRQADIRQLQDSLNRGGNAMAETAKNELVRTIDAKTKAFNRDLEDAQGEGGQETQQDPSGVRHDGPGCSRSGIARSANGQAGGDPGREARAAGNARREEVGRPSFPGPSRPRPPIPPSTPARR